MPLEETVPLRLDDARRWRPRALINQTDTRLAFATHQRQPETLVLRGHLRTQSEIGPYWLARVYQAESEIRWATSASSPCRVCLKIPAKVGVGAPSGVVFGLLKHAASTQAESGNNSALAQLIRLGLAVKDRPRSISKKRQNGGLCSEAVESQTARGPQGADFL